MVTFKGEIKDVVKTFENEFILTITTNASNLSEELLKPLQDSKNGLKIDMCKWKEKRSLDSNAYCWQLMDKIAKAQHTTKEEVYKMVIHKVGVFVVLPIKNEAVDTFVANWGAKGLGWVCDSLGESKLKGFTKVVAYYGTSTYNTEEMSKFIDEVVYIAKENNIQTETPEQINEMKSLWRNYEK